MSMQTSYIFESGMFNENLQHIRNEIFPEKEIRYKHSC